MGLTYAQAYSKIGTEGYTSVADLQRLIQETSGAVIGDGVSTYILYSGKFPDGTPAHTVQKALESNPIAGVATIADSHVGQLLEHLTFKKAFFQAVQRELIENVPGFADLSSAEQFPIINERYTSLITGEDLAGNRVNSSSLWDVASRSYVSAADGAFRVIAPTNVSDLSIFVTSELPALLENPNVTEIDGIPRAELIEMRDKVGLDKVKQFISANSLQQVFFSDLANGNVAAYLELTPESLNEQLKDPVKLGAWMEHLKSLTPEQMAGFDLGVSAWRSPELNVGSRVLNRLSFVGAVLGFTLAALQASEAEAAGDPEGAKEIMKLWAVDAAGAEVGAAIGAAVGTIAVGVLIGAEVAVGALIAGAIILGASIIGGIFGGDAATDMYQLLKDLDANGRLDIIDKLDDLLFGTSATLTTPLPEDLNGARLTLEANFSEGEVVENAKLNIAWRYALRELNPFVVDDISYDRHNLDGSLDLFDPVSGTGSMTESYLHDRAAMLVSLVEAWKLKTYQQVTDNSAKDGFDYRDFGSGYQVLVLPDPLVSFQPLVHRVYFGGGTADTLEGQRGNDRFYGMGGNDTLKGEGGNDYLEGGIGNDSLLGGGDNDTLVGMSGDDILDGGSGNDRLEGGKGKDVYIIDGSAGTDTIVDIDGGVLKYDGHVLVGGEAISPGAVEWKDDYVTYSLVTQGDGQDLHILVDANTVIIKDWVQGKFGVTLADAPEPVPPEGGNIIVDDGETPLLGTAGHDFIYGLDGDDHILGRDGGDFIDGGSGQDFLVSDEGNDTFIGGAGSDGIHAMAGDDYLFADQQISVEEAFEVKDEEAESQGKGDFLEAGSGRDFAVGSNNADALLGGEGRDILIGMSGDDVIYGDAYSSYGWATPGNWEPQVVDLYQEESEEYVDSGDFIYGGVGNDTVFGNQGQDLIEGGAGHDLLVGGKHGDRLIGGEGNDSLYGDSLDSTLVEGYDDYLLGGSGNDGLYGGGGNDILEGEGDHDSLWGGAGADTLDGGTGNDSLVGDSAETDQGADLLHGGADNDSLWGMGGNDTLHGDEGDDSLLGGTGYDRLFGGADKDVLVGEAGDDTLEGGNGDDQLFGGEDNDVLIGGLDNDYLSGGNGNNNLDGGVGNDTLSAGTGNDRYRFGAGYGQDALVDTGGSNIVSFGAGLTVDSLQIDLDAEGTLGIRASGTDLLIIPNNLAWANSIFEFADGTRLTLNQLLQHIDSPINQNGTDQNDSVYGANAGDTLHGNAGDDLMVGNKGADTLLGGAGSDTYVVGRDDGSDVVIDELGSNSVVFGEGIARDAVIFKIVYASDGEQYLKASFPGGSVAIQNGAFGSVESFRFADGAELSLKDVMATLGGTSIKAPDGDAHFYGSNAADVLEGSAGNDVIEGQGGNDLIKGGGGNDDLSGDAGDDRLLGGGGSDLIMGGAGNDTLLGGSGNDTLIGGLGANEYVFASGQGADRISLQSGEVATLRLDAGIELQDLMSQRVDEDLVLTLKDGSGSVRLEGFYLDGAEVQVVTASTAAQPLEAALESIAPDPVQDLAGWEREFQREVLAEFGRRASGEEGETNQYHSYNTFDTSHTYTEQHYIAEAAFIREYGASDYVDWRVVTTSEAGSLSRNIYHHVRGGTSEVLDFGPTFTPVYADASESIENLLSQGGLEGVLGIYNDNGVLQGWLIWPESFGGPVSYAEVPKQFSFYTQTTHYDYKVAFGTDESAETLIRSGNIFYAGAGNDLLSGDFALVESGEAPPGAHMGAMLAGQEGNDTILGGNGNDLIIGGVGNDLLRGHEGEDTYVFMQGDGVDIVFDEKFIDPDSEFIPLSWSQSTFANELNDVVVLPDQVALADLELAWGEVLLQGNYQEDILAGAEDPITHAVMPYTTLDISWGTGQQIRIVIPHHNDVAGSGIEVVRFFDGTSLTLDQLIELGQLGPIPGIYSGGDSLSGGLQNGGGEDADARPTPLAAGAGDDVIDWDGYVLAGAGNDVVAGRNRDDRLYGDSGNDELTGREGRDTLIGGSGNDILNGGEDSDVLDGGAGDDTLQGGAGSDVYVFGRGSGNDTLLAAVNGELNSEDTILLEEGMVPDDIDLEEVDNDLVLVLRETGDRLTIKDYFSDTIAVEFYDGWDFDEVVRNRLGGTPGDDTLSGSGLLRGGRGNDYLTGQDGDDTLDGGAGNDYLDGGAGSDLYLFAVGSGSDTIAASWEEGTERHDVLRLGDGIELTDIVSRRIGLDLLLTIGEQGDQVRIEGYFPNEEPGGFSPQSIKEIQFADGSILDAAMLNALPQENESLFGTDAADLIQGSEGNNELYGYSGNDTLDGGAGDDNLYGGLGDDVYLFGRGSGSDTISSAGEDQSEWDRVLLASNVGEADIEVSRSSSDLQLTISETGESLWIYGYFDDFDGTGRTGLGVIQFASGQIWSLEDVESRLVAVTPTEYGDKLYGTSAGDLIQGLDGDDSIMSDQGNDTLIGGAGEDLLYGGGGDDLYIVMAAADHVAWGEVDDYGGVDELRFASVTANETLVLGEEDYGLDRVVIGTGMAESAILTGTQALHVDASAVDSGLSLTGNAGTNSLTGTAYEDVLDGGVGSDTLIGGEGDDTYVFGRGYGADTATENDATDGNTDIVQFLDGIAVDQLWFSRSSDDLEVGVIGTSDKLTVKDWYESDAHHIEQFKTADGMTLMDSQVQNLVDAMAAFAPPPTGQTSLPENYQTELASVIATNWQ